METVTPITTLKTSCSTICGFRGANSAGKKSALPNTIRCLSALILLAAGFAPCASGTHTEQDLYSLGLRELLQVSIRSVSLREEALAEAPARVVVINAHDIRERGYVNLFDLLADLSAVDTHARSHETTYNNIAIRGIEGNKFVVTLNGVPISSPAGDPIPYADNFPLFDLERVEIVMSPISAIYGADTYSGLINLVSREGDKNELTIGARAGDYNTRYGHFYGHAWLGDSARVMLSGHGHAAANPDLDEHYPDSYVYQDLVNFSGQTVVTADQRGDMYSNTRSRSMVGRFLIGDTFELGFRKATYSSPTSTGLLPFSVDYAEQAAWNTELGTLYSRYRGELSDAANLSVTAQKSQYKVTPGSRFNNIFSNFNNGYKYALSKKTQLDATLELNPAGKHTWVMGLQLTDFSAIPKTADLSLPYNQDQSLLQQNLYYSGTDNTIKIQLYDINYLNTAGFVHLNSHISNNTQAVFGLRLDENSRYGSSLNPRMGVLHNFNKDWAIKFLYGEAFLAPAPEFTYEHFGGFTGEQDTQGRYLSNFMFVPNPDLKPEELKTFEINTTYSPSSHWLVEMTAYSTRADGHILNTATAEPQSDFIDGGFINFTSNNENIGDMEILGFTLDGQFQRPLATAQLKFWGNYSYTDGDYHNSHSTSQTALPFIAQHKVKLGSTISIDRYFATLKGRWIDKTSVDVAALVGEDVAIKEVRAYSVFDFIAGVALFNNTLDLSLQVRNLLDKRYYNAGTNASITFAETPQEPRRILLSAELSF